MKLAFVADTHFRGKDLDATARAWAKAIEMMQDGDVDHCFVAGDIYDRSNIVDASADAGAIIEAIKAPLLGERVFYNPQFHFLVGNHDAPGAGGSDALWSLDGIEKINIIRRPQILTGGCPGEDHFGVAMVPWVWRPKKSPGELFASLHSDLSGRIAAEIESYKGCERPPSEEDLEKNPSIKILTAHIQVIGAKMSATETCEGGKWAIGREELNSLDYDHFALGDFHGRQDLTDGRGGYIGALRQMSHGEEGNPRGFEIFDTLTREVEWVDIDSPIYRTAEWVEGDPAPEPIPGTGTIERLRILCNEWRPSMAEIKHAERDGATVVLDLIRPERVARAEIDSADLFNPDKLIRIWARTQNPPVGEETVEAMINRMAFVSRT